MTINPFILHGEEITPVRKLLYLKALAGGAPLSEYEVTGNPVSFNTNVAKPLSVLAVFSPVQAGSGDPSPENVRPITGWSGANVWRTGKNLFDKQNVINGYFSPSGGITSIYGSNSGRTVWCPCNPNTTYVCTKMQGGQRFNIYFTEEEPKAGTVVYSGTVISSKGYYERVITSPSNAKYMCLFVWLSTADTEITAQDMIDSVQVELGETATTFEEYTGQSVAVTFPAFGKNLLNPAELEKGLYTNADFDRTSTTSEIYRSIKAHLAPGTYTISFDKAVNIVRIVKDGVYANRGVENISSYSFTTETDSDFGVSWRDAESSSTEWDDSSPVMMNSGNTALPYEPYNATAYGGTLDLSTGVLTVEWYGNSYKWSEGTNESSVGETLKKRRFSLPHVPKTGSANNICNVAPYNSGSAESTKFNVSVTGNNAYAYVTLPNDTDEDTEIQIVSVLATPLVYQLTPTEILSLVGDNVVWSDLNGDLSVTYKKKG